MTKRIKQSKANSRACAWICHECAIRSGATVYQNHCATFHKDICGVCKQEKEVTEPRDYKWS